MAENPPAAKSPRRAKSAQPAAAGQAAEETKGGGAPPAGKVAGETSPPAKTSPAKPRVPRSVGKAAGKAAAGAGTVAAATRRKAAEGRAPPVPYSAAAIAEIFRRFAVQRPEPTSELEHSNVFTLLVAVVLSAQMTDMGVNRATRGLFAKASDAKAMAALGEEAIRHEIRQVGFFRAKARNVARLSEQLLALHGGAVPRERAALEALPGVGRKTASVILNTAFGEETLAVDTHILRLGNRLKLAPGGTPEEVERRFLAIIPAGFLRHAHHWLILHGRYVCKARKPDCPACIIADLCRADEKWCDVPAPLIALPAAGPGPQPIPPGAAVPPARRAAEA